MKINFFSIFIMISLPLRIYAQKDTNYKGIRFEKGLTWEQIKEKASLQNKQIFVDCYATWCGPCKEMDQDVYSDEQVGSIINDQFISVKVQIDSSKNDNSNIKILYSAAREMEKKYNITGFPTYLFFSSEGKAIHKQTGALTRKEFISLIHDSLDTTEQIYTLYHKYKSGKMAYDKMPILAKKLKTLNEDSIAFEVAKEYMHGYLDKLDENDFCKKENLELIRSYHRMVSSKDRIAKLYFEQPKKIDSAMMSGSYSRNCLKGVITREEIRPLLDKAEKDNKNPDWKHAYKIIESKYNKDYAVNTVLEAKQNWYLDKKDWKNYIKTLMQLWKARPEDFNSYSWMYLNNMAWKICVYSTDKEYLTVALIWINMAIPMLDKPNIAMLDTKSNLIYKLGFKDEAITIQKQVIELINTTYNDKVRKDVLLNYQQNLVNKMVKGAPLWKL